MRPPHPPLRAATRWAVIVALLPLPPAWAQEAAPAPASTPVPAPAASPFWFPQGLSIGLGTWSGALGLNYSNSLQSMSAPDASSSNQTSAFSESLRIGNSFYIINPLLLIGHLALDLQLNQDQGVGDGSTAKGKVIGYAFDATLLQQKPYTAVLAANRSQLQTLLPSGGRVLGVIENRSAVLQLRQDSIFNDWGYPWLEASLSLEQEKNQSTSTSFGLSQTTDEQNRRLTLEASKGFETADLGFNYQLGEQQNATFAQSNFQSSSAGLRYSGDFGPTLNRRLDAVLSYGARNGIAPATTLSNSEHLHIDHYQNLSTDYRYGINQQTSNGASSSAQTGAFSVSHQFYKNLSSKASLSASRSTLPNGVASTYGTQLSQSYSHSLPGKGSLNLNWSGGYQMANNQLSDPTIGVIDEVHVAEPPLITRTGFLLNHPFALASSLVVLNVKNGGRIPLRDAAAGAPGGGDYEVIVENNQIRIVPLPTSLLLNAGDPLAVSYNYQVDAKLESNTKSSGFGMGLSYGWISASLGHRQSKQTALNQSSSQFLQNTQNDFMRLALQGRLLEMATHANLDFESNKTTDTASNKRHLGAGLTWETESLRALLDVNASSEKFTLPDQHTTTTRTATSSVQWSNMSMIVSVNASDSTYTWLTERNDSLLAAQTSLNWYAQSGWSHSAVLDWSKHQVGAYPPETLLRATAKSSITLGLLSLNTSLGLGQWLRAGSRSYNRSFYVAAVRQF